MRILHITTTRSGSTGSTATSLKSLLINRGEQFRIAYSEPDDNPLDGDIFIGNRLDHKVHAFLSRLLGLQGYFSLLATKLFLRQIKDYSPDLVQLGNLHANYINLPLLFKFLAQEKIPVVMILHDCWFFTGKCTHFTERKCEKWRQECHHCPALHEGNVSWFFDRTRKMFNDRMKWYKSLKSLTVVAVSEWERNLALQSPLFKSARVTRVYNWIDTAIFKPATQEEIQLVMTKYNLLSDKKYVVSVGSGWSAVSTKTRDALRFSSLLPDNYRLIVVGTADESVFPDPIVHIPYVSESFELAVLYSLSLAYIHFSVEDTFGKVIAEAMACGTVPVVFDSTACGEIAGPYGLVVEPHDIPAMIDALQMAKEVERKKSVRSYAVANYASPESIDDYWRS